MDMGIIAGLDVTSYAVMLEYTATDNHNRLPLDRELQCGFLK